MTEAVVAKGAETGVFVRSLPVRIATALRDERETRILWAPVLAGCGIAVYFMLPVQPAPAITTVVLLTVLAGLRLAPLTWRPPLIALTLIVAGFGLAQFRTALVAAPVLEREMRGVTVVGDVLSAEPREGGERRLVIGDLAASDRPAIAGLERLRVTVRTDAGDVAAGDRVRFMATLSPPPEPVAPGAFDFARDAYFQRLGAVGYALSPVDRLNASSEAGWRVALDRLRERIAGRVHAQIDGAAGAMSAALLTGLRGAIPEADTEAMRAAGLAHLLAISGLHMGLVVAATVFAIRAAGAAVPAIALRLDLKRFAALCGWVVALVYLLLAGATLPTQRAFLMTSVVLLALLLGRQPVSMRLVAFAAAVILAMSPEALLSASFQMSFAAVVALVAAYERLAPRMGETFRGQGVTGRLSLYFLGLIATTIIAEIAIAPFAIFHFQQLPLYGLLANMVAVPVMAFWVMPLGLLALLLMPLGVEAPILTAMSWGVEIVLDTAHAVSDLPGSVQAVPAYPTLALGLGALAVIWVVFWRDAALRSLALMPAVLAVAVLAGHEPPDIYISRDAGLIGIRTPDGLFVSSTRRDGYSRDHWALQSGHFEARPWDGEGGPARCDSLGCFIETGAPQPIRISAALSADAVPEDCRRADILIAAVPVRTSCPAPDMIIDRLDVWREGAHAIRLTPHGPRVQSVAAWRGDRPWVRQRPGVDQ